MRGKKKHLVLVAALMAVVLVVVGIQVTSQMNSRMHIQQARVAMFYSNSFNMESSIDTSTSSFVGMVHFDGYPTADMRIEYVMEYPPVEQREFAVIYIKPDDGILNYSASDISGTTGKSASTSATQAAVDRLNRIIEADSGITVDASLSLPLTVDQIVSSPDAVLEIIKQLDSEQWEEFYRWDNYSSFAKILAGNAGIKVPEK